jgi:hypothetical protein
LAAQLLVERRREQLTWPFCTASRSLGHFAEMQKTITEAMQNTSRQVTAAVEEMRKRMTDLQTETQQTGQEVANQSSAGEEDPLAGIDQEVPTTSRRRKK